MSKCLVRTQLCGGHNLPPFYLIGKGLTNLTKHGKNQWRRHHTLPTVAHLRFSIKEEVCNMCIRIGLVDFCW